ncbi:hypothetical protein NA56DRAFT_753571 [Hyaloscypha hepaticicola]|uniref:F-box domain-containing protein n=1 Tax=Hyaloscypha hepaticicola TaxID=2082293 RepID=A0A2J6PPM1_9HELO|nr:hypothetical protein NA56DRAFT_753571 [Hyaloscypha hepaticicola]
MADAKGKGKEVERELAIAEETAKATPTTLITLAPELKTQIFEHLPFVSKICLALTCKSLYAAYETFYGKMAPVSLHDRIEWQENASSVMTTIPLELNVCLRGALSDAIATCLALARGWLSGLQVTSWRVSKLSVNMATLREKQRAVSLARANTR